MQNYRMKTYQIRAEEKKFLIFQKMQKLLISLYYCEK